MTSVSKPLVDHRVYTITLRKMPEFLRVFNELAMPVLLQTLGHPIGFYTSLVGPQNQFIHLMKNGALGGGFLMLAANGAGAFSVDAWRRDRQLSVPTLRTGGAL